VNDFKQITIIGVGLIGGSLGLAFKNLSEPPLIVGVARHKETITRALEVGAIDKGATSYIEGVKNANIIFIATPVGSIVDIVRKIYPHLESGTIITDVGSTKANIVHGVEAFLPKYLHFIGGHPMTGSERTGVQAASASLFKNAYYLLTPTPRTNMNAFQHLHSLLTKIGALILAIDPDKHDKILATISHLPHILSATLVDFALKQTTETENPLLLAAGGFRDMTRIAASSPEIWSDICLENDAAILEALEEFQREIEDFSRFIKKRDRDGLVKKLEEARKTRLGLPSFVYKDLAQLRELSIPVIDKPGVISDITVTIGGMGINIENIEIVPSTEYSGILKLVIAGDENSSKVAEALHSKGYEVSIRSLYNREVR